VIVTADDPELHSSQNEQDNGTTRPREDPMLERRLFRGEGVHAAGLRAFGEVRHPVFLRTTTDLPRKESSASRSGRPAVPAGFVPDPAKW